MTEVELTVVNNINPNLSHRTQFRVARSTEEQCVADMIGLLLSSFPGAQKLIAERLAVLDGLMQTIRKARRDQEVRERRNRLRPQTPSGQLRTQKPAPEPEDFEEDEEDEEPEE